MEISKLAAQAIVYSINYHLEDLGLDHIPTARALAIQVAADVKRTISDEMLRMFKAEERRLGMALTPPADAEGPYKQGWTNGKKFALHRLSAFIEKKGYEDHA